MAGWGSRLGRAGRGQENVAGIHPVVRLLWV